MPCQLLMLLDCGPRCNPSFSVPCQLLMLLDCGRHGKSPCLMVAARHPRMATSVIAKGSRRLRLAKLMKASTCQYGPDLLPNGK